MISQPAAKVVAAIVNKKEQSRQTTRAEDLSIAQANAIFVRVSRGSVLGGHPSYEVRAYLSLCHNVLLFPGR